MVGKSFINIEFKTCMGFVGTIKTWNNGQVYHGRVYGLQLLELGVGDFKISGRYVSNVVQAFHTTTKQIP